MKIVFSSRAKTDLAEHVQYIASDKPRAAREWSDSIRQAILRLSNFPRLGRTVPEYGDETLREILKGQYRIVYKVDDKKQQILVVTIHHSKRPLV